MTNHYYANWHDVPDKLWHWPNFSPEEIACRGDGTIRINEAALDKLQALRERLGVPLIVHSSYRSPDYNRRVGGAKHSMHLQGAAFDISMANHDPAAYEKAARTIGFTGFGFYPRQNFMHIDIGRARQWGDPFPPRAGRFADEPPRLRESLIICKTSGSVFHFQSGTLIIRTLPSDILQIRSSLKWSCFIGQFCGLSKMHQICVHAAFRVPALPKYALSGVRLSRAV